MLTTPSGETLFDLQGQYAWDNQVPMTSMTYPSPHGDDVCIRSHGPAEHHDAEPIVHRRRGHLRLGRPTPDAGRRRTS